MFLPERTMSIGDKMIKVPGSTALLTTGEMVEYTDRCIGLAHELGCVVQSPEEAGYVSSTTAPVTGYGRD
jgi:hypothetical protein